MKGKILVVDDEKNARRTWADILRLEGYAVTAVGSGEEAVVQMQQENFDIMLLDLRMPGMDGLEVLGMVPKLAPGIKVIVLTAHGSLDSAITALRQGAHDYLLKPATAAQVLNSVASAFAMRAEDQHRRLLIGQLESSLQQLKSAEGIQESAAPGPQVVSLGEGVMMDFARREIWRGQERVLLTPTEGKLMKVLWDNRGRVLSHRELVFMVQGYETTDWEAPEVLRPLVSRLRRKLAIFPSGENWIGNVRGTGYVFEVIEGGAI